MDSLIYKYFKSSATKSSEKIVKILLAAGANPDSIEHQYSFTPLSTSLLNNYHNMIDILIEYGANINAVSFGGQTPLMVAVYHKNTKKLSLLIKSGADIEIRDEFGYTALIHSIRANRMGSLELLISEGANLEAVNEHGMTALMFACGSKADLRFVKALVMAGADTTKKNNFGKSALDVALENQRPDIVSYLESL